MNPMPSMALLFLLATPTAQAVVTAVTVAPGNAAVPVGQTTTLQLRWTVERNADASGRLPAGDEVVSERGEFRDDAGRLLGRVERRLRQTRPVSPSDVFDFRETVRVPTALLYQAHSAGLTRIHYQRAFDDGYGPRSAAAELRLTSAAAAAFGLSRLALSFEGGWLHRLVAPGEALRPRAVVNFTGSGQLRATWEVAEPATTRGEPVFRPLQSVRRYLTGGGEATLEGPALPTRDRGTYLLRLRIDAPETGFAPPVLRYVVAPTEETPTVLKVQSPAVGAPLTPETRFQWTPVAGARAYQVEIRATESVTGPPLTGLVTTAERQHATLPAHTRRHLPPGRYYWRLLAIGAQGDILAASAPRELRVGAP